MKRAVTALTTGWVEHKPGSVIEAVICGVQCHLSVARVAGFVASGITRAGKGRDFQPVDGCLKVPGNAEIDRVVQVTCVNIGNPHAVVFVDDATQVPLDVLGPQIENHIKFPERTNVEFVNVIDRDNIVMRIWERGSGETMASGSGSCGAALASMITERTRRKVNVHLVYGTLKIEWSEDGDVYQEGPATEVYTGVWPTNGHAG